MENLINQSNIVSKDFIKVSPEYRDKVKNIKHTIGLKYRPLIKQEKNIIKKLFLLLNKHLEIRKLIKELTSPNKMYFS